MADRKVGQDEAQPSSNQQGAFERWARERGWDIYQPYGHYQEPRTAYGWAAWQARAAHVEQLRVALDDVSIWLRAALGCKQWVWDSDQRLAAEGCLVQAKSLLSGDSQSAPETRAPLQMYGFHPRTGLHKWEDDCAETVAGVSCTPVYLAADVIDRDLPSSPDLSVSTVHCPRCNRIVTHGCEYVACPYPLPTSSLKAEGDGS